MHLFFSVPIHKQSIFYVFISLFAFFYLWFSFCCQEYKMKNRLWVYEYVLSVTFIIIICFFFSFLSRFRASHTNFPQIKIIQCVSHTWRHHHFWTKHMTETYRTDYFKRAHLSVIEVQPKIWWVLSMEIWIAITDSKTRWSPLAFLFVLISHSTFFKENKNKRIW